MCSSKTKSKQLFQVCSNDRLSDTYFKLRLRPTEEMPPVMPGQFVNILVPDSPTTFLRRPISVCDYNGEELTLLIRIAGDGTRRLSEIAIGSSLDLVAPLGNTFSVPATPGAEVLLIGGGVGVAPLLYWGKELKKQGYIPSFLIGARTDADLLMENEFESIGALYVTTEDGSKGEKGFVTNHSVMQRSFAAYSVCGPHPMMVAVARIAKANGTPCEVSLENTMACGIGVCLCCVEDTVRGNVCVCSEGPIFSINELKWSI